MSEASYSDVALVYIISGELTMLQVDTSLYFRICVFVHFAQNNAIVLFFLWIPNMVLKSVNQNSAQSINF
jgi:hypothetical protein